MGGLLIEGAEVGKLCQSQVAGDGKCKKGKERKKERKIER